MSAATEPITIEGIEQSIDRIRPLIRRTPCIDVHVSAPEWSGPVTLKLESLQVTGSFKPRGAVNSLLSSGADEVIACSGGNHGLAVAWAAHALGRRATVVVPASAARAKVDAMQRLGAEVIEHGDTPGDAFQIAESLVAQTGHPLVHPYDQVATVEGQGSLGLELHAQAPLVTHWLIAVGGGGLAAGVVVGLDGSAEVVPVEPTGCPTLSVAQGAGGPVPSLAQGIARTSLGAPSLGAIPWHVLAHTVGASTLVDDDAIIGSQVWLWEQVRLLAEPGGATALAALQCGAWRPPRGALVGVVVCGGNADSIPDLPAPDRFIQ
ncbi:MAG: pyridoxal-phosphate dependent enzyme [Actinomycetes bacterium]